MFVRAIVLSLALLAGSASAQTVTIIGLDGQSKTLSVADLASMMRAKADLKKENGTVLHYEGVPLATILQS